MICLNLFLSVFVRCKCSVFFLIKQHLKKQSRTTKKRNTLIINSSVLKMHWKCPKVSYRQLIVLKKKRLTLSWIKQAISNETIRSFIHPPTIAVFMFKQQQNVRTIQHRQYAGQSWLRFCFKSSCQNRNREIVWRAKAYYQLLKTRYAFGKNNFIDDSLSLNSCIDYYKAKTWKTNWREHTSIKVRCIDLRAIWRKHFSTKKNLNSYSKTAIWTNDETWTSTNSFARLWHI